MSHRNLFAYGNGGFGSFKLHYAVNTDRFVRELVYLPVAWVASLAACSMATCLKACSRVARDDGRPNERRTSRAESCMLRHSVSRKFFSSMFIIFVFDEVKGSKFQDSGFKIQDSGFKKVTKGFAVGWLGGCGYTFIPPRHGKEEPEGSFEEISFPKPGVAL